MAEIEKLSVSGVIDEAALRKASLVNGNWSGIKVLGNGEVTKAISLKVHAISASAREKIEKAGGSIELIAGRTYPARNSAKQAALAKRKPKA